MAAVTDATKLETAYKEVWDSSQKVLKPFHPAIIKVPVVWQYVCIVYRIEGDFLQGLNSAFQVAPLILNP